MIQRKDYERVYKLKECQKSVLNDNAILTFIGKDVRNKVRDAGLEPAACVIYIRRHNFLYLHAG
jgi:hypothetical protein